MTRQRAIETGATAGLVAALIVVVAMLVLPSLQSDSGTDFDGPMMLARTSGERTLLSAVVTTTNGTQMSLLGCNTVIVHVEGITTATITWEGTVDNTNWIGIAAADLNSTTRARSLTDAADGLYQFEDIGGLAALRARVSAYTAGTITAKARCS